MDTITVGMVDPLGQIVRECEAGNLPRKSVAMTMAFALRQERFPSPGWDRALLAVRARFGEEGDAWIRRRAWEYAEGRRRFGT